MKKIFISLLAVAALAACTKSEVAYEAPAEITFAPAAKNITKAAHGDVDQKGTYPTEQRLGVFANYGSVDPTQTANVTNFATKFLENELFSYSNTAKAWGSGESWPANGSLIFAGYAIAKEGNVNGNGTYTYDFNSDKLTITGYTQSNVPAQSFDLGWFSRTPASYNYRNSASSTVPVTLSHALAWVEILVKGEGTTIGTNPWIIKSVTMNNVATKGNAECIGTGANKATWSGLSEPKNITVFAGEQALTVKATVCETEDTDVIVIPQTPTVSYLTDGKTIDVQNSAASLTIVYTYESPASTEDEKIMMPDQTVTVPLVLGTNGTDGWKSGYKYTYTLTFKASEILIAPDYGTWANGGDQTVTVE